MTQRSKADADRASRRSGVNLPGVSQFGLKQKVDGVAWLPGCVRCSGEACCGSGEESLWLHWQPVSQQRHVRLASDSAGRQQACVAAEGFAGRGAGWQQQHPVPCPAAFSARTVPFTSVAQPHAPPGNPCRGTRAARSQTIVLEVSGNGYMSNQIHLYDSDNRHK